MRQQLQHIREQLANAGLKATQQRMVVYHTLLETMHMHPTAENIYEHVKPENPSISLGTIYKTLDTLVACGLATRVSTASGYMRYDANMDRHNHIYCANTREIIDYHDAALDEIVQAYFERKNIPNLKITNIHVQINGDRIDPEQRIHIQE